MIDTYMDRASWPTWMNPAPTVDRDDPRYWNGALYNTVIDRMVAEAKAVMCWTIGTTVNNHRHEIRHGVRLGSVRSIFEPTGRMKTIWSRK